MYELGEGAREEEAGEHMDVSINNIANKLANILYITNVSMKENFGARNALQYAKFINDMKSYSVNLIQAMNNISADFYSYTCLPVHTIPRNPYNNIQDVNTITSNLSVDDGAEKIKEDKNTLHTFRTTYHPKDFDTILKHIEQFNDNIFSALNNMQHAKASSQRYAETQTYGTVLSDRLKSKERDSEHLEVYVAKVNYGLF
ncbi:conserved Plasmodium protein, unknown function [Plasmodium knowlesi strain H]|uniref:Uncharacterized protein n=2 Tax=Plasmodium knowlesi (strain H) TaxID=5851 RepID=A0A5K1V4V3_PLAKH|nr:mediator of RNA polymerase II transcription subunit 8, putative [Plasmodium knowlesi strain H]CAA9986518.1 mediator of RNA polymerase II transcription subunit 8, putative [Plasmodium knowlesi strain H]SBO24220.1 conserved Plasmodium protein, unknown function [Plasmodium knowlesi strain H]SBO29765.1 conserved Plasmodium protein, unknown function [Plasmodium knowlesi strain H]VVS75992.1 mediator of RNA polymerase II transcription subunit 8, putative [Plasmodium knowlesi strain H]|eukprot:XP_002261069.1 hypothetical protein, conserved in Plasmodium species [Plasmodium knowlesi strain H]